ncbi:hypothetical protein P43SY_000990 [Pythium insidiosum]|uniref:Transmembrane protein n=1 Tax=Pythium insidiosum TaxID=114742 RepID=A0AAD5Q472_PYTIN|nr:hypothetical protein P43SY_000990 [Pythium insidiosum]
MGKRLQGVSGWNLLEFVYNCSLWGFVATLVFSQFLGIIWNTVTSRQHLIYGRHMSEGLYAISGYNDEPYADRNIICIAEGRSFVPTQLSKALKDSALSKVVDTSGTAVNSYRIVWRDEITLDDATAEFYTPVCDKISAHLDKIQTSCSALGYNITRDSLRVTDDTFSTTTKIIPRALPILIMPFWDNGIYAHYAIPTWDGIGCLFRLNGNIEQPDQPDAVFRSVSRDTRDAKTREWLMKPGGVWRNGWYEDGSGQRFYSDFISTNPEDPFGILARQFDGKTGLEYDCKAKHPPSACFDPPRKEWWGSEFSMTETVSWYNSVAMSNGTRYGLFIYEASQKRVVESKYTLETFISNISLGVMLLRWLVCILSLLNSYRLGVADWHNASIGSLSCARSFNVLPLVLLPRLKFTLAAFWTVGCEFEGQQKALSEAWFAIYPGIAEFMLFFYSLLNFLAKLLHRRVSDKLFGPTLLFFCLMHRFRIQLAQSGWFEFDGRISTVILSSQVDELRLADFFTTDAALRMNGNIRSMFFIKVAVLGLNLLPLVLFSDSMTTRGYWYRSFATGGVEKALAMRASYLISIDDWYVVTALAPLRMLEKLWNHRIMVFSVTRTGDGFTPNTESKMSKRRTSYEASPADASRPPRGSRGQHDQRYRAKLKIREVSLASHDVEDD